MENNNSNKNKNGSGANSSNSSNNNNKNKNNANQQLLCCAFNQDGGCLALGTNDGFSILNLNPFQASVQRRLNGGIGSIEMLFRCNLIALVGGGAVNPYAPSHRVLIWDDHVQKAIGELSFRQVVLRVKLRRDAIAVALRDRVYVYHLADLSLRDKIYTADNPHGLLCLSTAISDMVLACPSVTEGQVRVERYGVRKVVLIDAHESALQALAMTEDGTKLATASIKGTVIRVWDVATATCVMEFRRGVERVHITGLAWSWDHQHLACCSDKGTTHVFRMFTREEQEARRKKQSSSLTNRLLTTVKQSILDVDQPKSISHIRGVPHPQACAFVPDLPNTLAVVGYDIDGNGVLLLSDFSTEEATRVAYRVVVKSHDESQDELLSEGAQRRRRMLGISPFPAMNTPVSPEDGKLYVGERVEVLENQMRDIRFEEQDEGFLTVSGFETGNNLGDEKKEHDGDEEDGVVAPESTFSEAISTGTQ